jgi:hypothetical protein
MMTDKYYAIIVLTICMTAIIIYRRERHSIEKFVSKHDKAINIVRWFDKHPTPDYNTFRKDLNKSSNIVEYEEARILQRNKNLSIGNLEPLL